MTAELYEKLTKIRRDIHQHPEVSERHHREVRSVQLRLRPV